MSGPTLVVLGRPLGTTADAIAVEGGRIAAIGDARELLAARVPGARVVGREGAVLAPGFVDAHLHLVALARRRLEVDCSATACPTLEDVVDAIRRAGRGSPPGSWIRAFGVDEALLRERRLPTLFDLDAASPARPVRLLHRTGHAAILNSVAVGRLGLAERFPTGVVPEPATVLAGRVPAAEGRELDRTIADASRELAARGVTTIHDPTPGMDADRLRAFAEHAAEGRIVQRLRLYGAEPTELRGVDPARIRVAGVKLVVVDADDPAEVAARVAELDREGVQIAIHAVEGGALAATVAALAALGPERVRAARHRIEHASLVPPPLALEIARLGVTVVTHPIFADAFAAKYDAEVPEEQRPWLYPMQAWRDAGVAVALGSDAPIAPADPRRNVVAAVRRGLSFAEGFAMHTAGGARAAGDEALLGELRVGLAADVVVWSHDPESPEAAVLSVVVGGRVVRE